MYYLLNNRNSSLSLNLKKAHSQLILHSKHHRFFYLYVEHYVQDVQGLHGLFSQKGLIKSMDEILKAWCLYFWNLDFWLLSCDFWLFVWMLKSLSISLSVRWSSLTLSLVTFLCEVQVKVILDSYLQFSGAVLRIFLMFSLAQLSILTLLEFSSMLNLQFSSLSSRILVLTSTAKQESLFAGLESRLNSILSPLQSVVNYFLEGFSNLYFIFSDCSVCLKKFYKLNIFCFLCLKTSMNSSLSSASFSGKQCETYFGFEIFKVSLPALLEAKVLVVTGPLSAGNVQAGVYQNCCFF